MGPPRHAGPEDRPPPRSQREANSVSSREALKKGRQRPPWDAIQQGLTEHLHSSWTFFFEKTCARESRAH